MNNYIRRAHIQDHANAAGLEAHWGYPSRVVPCVNDPGTCEYLGAVYRMHDLSMLFTFILWAVIGGFLVIWVGFRIFRPREKSTGAMTAEPQDAEGLESKMRGSSRLRAWRVIAATTNHYLLPESCTGIFGHVSRVQVVVLAGLLVYLLIFSLVGITYNTWITPVKKAPGKFNTRTGLGGFSDRVGALAYALTPLSILLSSRDSALSLLTGIPYTSFLFLHVWTGRVIFIQSFLHTLGWTIIEARLYQPQPSVYREFMAEMYIIFGVVAMFLVTVLYLGSLKIVVRRTGYQFFKLTHYITAALYLGACWGHWADLACWMIAAIILLALDRGVRLIRLLLIHTGHVDASNPIGFKSAKASIKVFADGDVGQIVRMEFEHNHGPWCAGQHFFLTFPALGWWQAHPFTPAALSSEHPRWQRHVYVLRVKKGITRRLADLALGGGGESSLDVLLTGPYGAGNELADSGTPRNTFAIAGGTGISFVLPAVLHRLSAKTETSSTSTTQLVWIIRISADIRWFLPELEGLKKTIEARTEYKEDKLGQSAADKVQIQILVTRESEDSTEAKAADPLPRNPTASDNSEVNRKETGLFQTATGSSSLAELLDAHCANGRFIRIQRLHNHHPDIGQLLDVFAASCSSGPIEVIGSGPPGMGSDLRSAVARLNQGGRVWRGEESGYVRLVCDAREL